MPYGKLGRFSACTCTRTRFHQSVLIVVLRGACTCCELLSAVSICEDSVFQTLQRFQLDRLTIVEVMPSTDHLGHEMTEAPLGRRSISTSSRNFSMLIHCPARPHEAYLHIHHHRRLLHCRRQAVHCKLALLNVCLQGYCDQDPAALHPLGILHVFVSAVSALFQTLLSIYNHLDSCRSSARCLFDAR